MATDIPAAAFCEPSYYRDPAPLLRRCRAAGPFVRVKFPMIGHVWMTTSHEAAGEVLKQPELIRIRRDDGRVTGLKWWMPRAVRVLTNNMLSHDDPDHRRLRGLVGEAFQRRSIASMEPDIAGIADRLTGEMAGRGGGDAVAMIARRLPVLVILRLLGLPETDRAWLEATLRRAMMVRSPLGFVGMLPALRLLLSYFEKEIVRQRSESGDGLIAHLIALRDEAPEEITAEELLAMIFLLFAAGVETTSHLISGGLRMILLNGQARARMSTGDGGAALIVEECLRFVSPVQVTKPRRVAEETEIGGRVLRRGDIVMAGLAAANHDPEAFDEPERFLPDRRPNPHLAFGTGPHFCLGFQLARLEANVFFERLFAAYDVEPAVPDGELDWRRRPGLNALAAFPVRVARRAG